MKPILLTIESRELRHRALVLRNPEPTVIREGITAVTGPNGSGKSTLGHILEKGWNTATNRITSPHGKLNVRMLEFNDTHSLTGVRAEYYQQRYESTMNDGIPTVAEIMGPRLRTWQWTEWSRLLELHDVDDKRINYLSSGELRKLLIINQLIDLPDLLILDNPYIGLDTGARWALDNAITAVARTGKTSVILLIPHGQPIPRYVEHNITIDACVIGAKADSDKCVTITELPGVPPERTGGTIVEMRDCSVTLGGRQILSGINWTIRDGETWALTGPNGSGKSTLLSLITADNPQAYRCNIHLFGHKRGSGESIWELKRRIGYVSPEMHAYFNGGGSTVESIVAHGLHDTVGEFTRITESQASLACQWLRLMGMEHLAQRRFNTLSAGEQRLTLITRTLIKRAPLLILDEPLHGLDAAASRRVRAVTDIMARESTLIYITHNPDELPHPITGTFTLSRKY